MNAVFNKGSMLLELCIAVAIFSIAIQGLGSGIYYFSESANQMQLYRQAIYESQTMTEDVQAALLNNFNNVDSSSTTTEIFAKHLVIHTISPCNKTAVAKVNWHHGLRVRETGMNVTVSDPHHALSVGGDCDQFPITATSTVIHTARGNDFISGGIDVLNKVAYTFENTVGTSTLVSHDSSNSFFNVSPIYFGDTINTIDAIHGYVFIGLATTSDQVNIFKTTPSGPLELESKITLPGVSGSFPGALSLAYYDNRLYVGVHRTAGHEFHIYDVTDRVHPQWLGSREMNHNINKIIVRKPYAYIASSGNIKDVIILDISDPSSIKQVSTVEIIGSEDAQGLYLLGSRLYVGRRRSSVITNPELAVIDVTQPEQPQVVASLHTGETINSVLASDNLIFALIKTNPAKILTIDISSSSPIIIDTRTTTQPTFSIDYEENTIYGI